MEHEENREHLAAWIRENTDYSPHVLDIAESPTRGELCIVDFAGLLRHHEWISTSKSNQDPLFYPVLVVHEEGRLSLEESLWRVVDETIAMPIQLSELRRRLQNLLDRRHLSRDLADQLDRTEDRYETVFNSVNDGILILKPDSDEITDSNPRASEILGYSRSELRTISPCEDLHAGDPDAFREFIDRVYDAGRARVSELACLHKDGSTITVEVSASVLDGGGEPRVVFSIRDITERREKEKLVEEQRDELSELNRITRTLYETARAVVQATDREGLESEMCRRLAASDDYQFAWIGAREDDGTVVPRAYSSEAESYLDQVRVTVDRTPTGQGPTGRAIKRDTVVTVQNVADDPAMEPWRDVLRSYGVRATAAVPIRDDERTFGVLNLYTSRRDAFADEEQEILDSLGKTIGRAITGFQAREEVQLFRQAVEHAGHAIYITDTGGTITYVNPAFEEITGYDGDYAIGRTPRILTSGEHGKAFYQDLWRTILSGETWEDTLINRRRDGRRVYIEQTIAPIIDNAGEIGNFVAVSTDISKTRRQQQQLQVLYRVLRHNLRNQLNIIEGYTSILEEVESGSRSRKALSGIEGAVNDLLRISEQARRIEGTFTGNGPTRERRSVRRVIGAAIDDVEFGSVTDRTVSIPEAEYRVNPELQTAVRELLKNAIDHNDAPKPELSILVETTTDDTQWLTIKVTDNGPGIPENERRVLREGKERPLLHGEGLGLWLANWIVSELGGDIEIGDNEPRGSVVTLHVPAEEER